MIHNIEYWIKQADFKGNDLIVFENAVEAEDYNLMRIIVDGVIDDLKVEIDENLVNDRLDDVQLILPRYKSLLQLESLILDNL